MSKITKEELLKIAQTSQLIIDPEDEQDILNDIENVLDYASCLNELSISDDISELNTNTNLFREDIVKSTDAAPLLALAPQVEERYYIVPVIIKQK